MTKNEELLGDLLRAKRRAKRRGDYNFDKINAEYKAVKKEIATDALIADLQERLDSRRHESYTVAGLLEVQQARIKELESLLLRAADDIEKGWLSIEGVEETYNTDGSWHVVQDIRAVLEGEKT
mgnify:CR=1 FL=1